jgi:diaminopimelate decarboxylase
LWNVAAIAAQTPFYVYDFGVIDARISSLRAVLPPSVDLHYAIKANPLPSLVQRIAPLVDGLDVASLRELQLALGTGVRPPDISFAGPGKKESELAAALAAGVVINVESASELARLERLQIETQQIARIALRVNLTSTFAVRAWAWAVARSSSGPTPSAFHNWQRWCGTVDCLVCTSSQARRT